MRFIAEAMISMSLFFMARGRRQSGLRDLDVTVLHGEGAKTVRTARALVVVHGSSPLGSMAMSA
eukprot:7999063-Pyramimonas_sp.AAC.1